MKLPDIQIVRHDRFFVVRDDLLSGGTKRRVLNKMLPEIHENLLIYAAHAYWYAWLALALSAQDYNKKVKLFFADEECDTKIFQDTISCKNVEYEIVEDIKTQWDLISVAKKYSSEYSWYCFPVWFKTNRFYEACVRMILELSIDPPEEVRCLWWSWTLATCIKKARPDTKLMIVDLWMWNWPLEWHEIYKASEAPSEVAKILPPYPSAQYYDAKIRQFANKFWSDWALIWNVA